MLGLDERQYESVATWLRDSLPGIESRDPVWSAFLKHSDLSAEAARSAVAFGTDPLVVIQDLGESDGEWRPESPTAVRIHERIVGWSGRMKLRDPDLEMLEAVLLHEIVHWAWGMRPDAEPEEKGWAFERDAYAVQRVNETGPQHLAGVPGDAGEPALGALSRHEESRGKPAAIGFDRVGGWSFGLYQLAAARGSVGRFIDFLALEPATSGFGTQLSVAGGNAAARAGSQVFIDTWKRLARDERFNLAQHHFIRATHYEPYVRGLRQRAIDLAARPAVVHDVAWSVSVQHGPSAFPLFTIPWASLSAEERADDAALIRAVYAERSRVDVYFRSSTASVRQSVLRRFRKEEAAALARLG